MEHISLLLVAFIWDGCVGDPRWLYHPVCAVGWLIQKWEGLLRNIVPSTKKGEQIGGMVLLLVVVFCSVVPFWGVLYFLKHFFGTQVLFWIEGIFCGILLATRSLFDQSMAVYHALNQGNLAQARQAVGQIVGRDTKNLDEIGVTKATVETVAENFCDGVVAPLFYVILGGSLAMLAFKAVSTLDSMVGYQNQRYENFGRASAKMDDLLNFVPSRLSGILLTFCAPFIGLSGKNALKIFLRDRKNHKSPNSAHSESAVAGALGVELGGGGIYGGKWVEKPTMGDSLREIKPNDIKKTNQLMILATTTLVVLCGIAWWGGIYGIV